MLGWGGGGVLGSFWTRGETFEQFLDIEPLKSLTCDVTIKQNFVIQEGLDNGQIV